MSIAAQQTAYTASSAASVAAAAAVGPHLLSLKVMRISAPTLATSQAPYFECHIETQHGSKALSEIHQGVPQSFDQDLLVSKGDNWGSSNVMVLPTSFGSIFLGETFRAYLCIRNESQVTLREPSLRIEMQVGDSDGAGPRVLLEHLLLDSPTSQDDDGNDVWELQPGLAMETTSSYDVKDLGAHVLVCTIGYKAPVTTATGRVAWQERSFRKFYKFPVPTSPISVRTKIHSQRSPAAAMHPDAHVRDVVALEVQVQNISGSPIVFEGLQLKTPSLWTWTSIDRPSLSSNTVHDDMWTGAAQVLADGDVRQYLFMLTPSAGWEKSAVDYGINAQGLHLVGDPIGHLDISWRMAQGEPGRLQTSQLLRRRVYHAPIRCHHPSATTTSIPVPLLSVQLTCRKDTLDTLASLTPNTTVDLGFSLLVMHTAAQQQADAPSVIRQASEEKNDEDDDRPLSELAVVSPSMRARASRSVSATSVEALKLDATRTVTLTRRLKLAIQHCSVERNLPVGHEASASNNNSQAGDIPSNDTMSASQASGLLGRTRLQANLSNLVRNTSLTVAGANPLARRQIENTATEAPTSSAPPSRTSTPRPAVPAKQAALPQSSVALLPPPELTWSSVSRLFAEHVESHAQALSRPPMDAGLHVPTTLLPSHKSITDNGAATAEYSGASLTALPDVELSIPLEHDTASNTYHAAKDSGHTHSSVDFDLSYTISAANHYEFGDGVVRFGALRVLLLGWSDALTPQDSTSTPDESSQNVTLDSAIVLKELLLVAEGMLA